MAARDKCKGRHLTQVSLHAMAATMGIDGESRGPSGATRQAVALRREGVQVGRGSLGELTIDFGVYGWFPSTLPSEEAEESESDDEGGVEGN